MHPHLRKKAKELGEVLGHRAEFGEPSGVRADVCFRANYARFSPSFGHRSAVALTVSFDPQQKSMSLAIWLPAGLIAVIIRRAVAPAHCHRSPYLITIIL